MSIFLSYSHKNKEIITPMAETLRRTFGQERVFCDQWSIQPGDSLIDKMNNGLEGCAFFIFFVSKASILSEMVKLEWQNAIIKKTKNNIQFIPVKVDDCTLPSILLQNIYIDLYRVGFDYALRQLVDVISGKNTYRPEEVNGFQNVRAYLSEKADGYIFEFRAEAYTEPHSKYVILVNNEENEVDFSSTNTTLIEKAFLKLNLSNGTVSNGCYIARSEATSPNFPMIVSLKAKGESKITFTDVMRAKSHTQTSTEFVPIPLIKLVT